MDLFVDDDLYNNESFASQSNWKIGKKPETDLKKIEFNINVNDDEIDDMNGEEAVYLNDGLADDNNNNIEDNGVQHE